MKAGEAKGKTPKGPAAKGKAPKGPAGPYEYAPCLEEVVAIEDVAVLVPQQGPGRPSGAVTKTSMAMSKMLRHDTKGRLLREDGYALVEKLRFPLEDVVAAVIENNKQRFAMARGAKTGQLYIRARQGHSVPGIKSLKMAAAVCKLMRNQYTWIWKRLWTTRRWQCTEPRGRHGDRLSRRGSAAWAASTFTWPAGGPARCSPE